MIYDWLDGSLLFPSLFSGEQDTFPWFPFSLAATSGGLVSVCQPGRTTFLFNSDPSTTAAFLSPCFSPTPACFWAVFFLTSNASSSKSQSHDKQHAPDIAS